MGVDADIEPVPEHLSPATLKSAAEKKERRTRYPPTTAPGDSMKRPTKSTLTGRWRITKMALWDKDFLDMMEPAYIAFDDKLGGEFALGCVTGDLHCRKTPEGIEFTWEGNNEMDAASGDGWAELQKDGSLEGEIRFHNGDDSTFKAHRW
jgi:hypothetical protein